MLIWYDGNESGVEQRELFDLLRRHGFVEGDYRTCDTHTRARIDELAEALMYEVTESEIERASQDALPGDWFEQPLEKK